jgi:hypothetical protein
MPIDLDRDLFAAQAICIMVYRLRKECKMQLDRYHAVKNNAR